MLKTYQVLLPNWLEEYIREMVERFDISFSEVIRLEVCFAIICALKYQYEDFEPSKIIEDIFNALQKETKGKIEREEILNLISTIYYETRKALEFRRKKQNELKKG